MTDSTYDRIRKQECELCANWMPICCKADGTEYHSHKSGKEHFPCTAPSRDEVIERLADDNEAAYMRGFADGSRGAVNAITAALKEEPNAR